MAALWVGRLWFSAAIGIWNSLSWTAAIYISISLLPGRRRALPAADACLPLCLPGRRHLLSYRSSAAFSLEKPAQSLGLSYALCHAACLPALMHIAPMMPSTQHIYMGGRRNNIYSIAEHNALATTLTWEDLNACNLPLPACCAALTNLATPAMLYIAYIWHHVGIPVLWKGLGHTACTCLPASLYSLYKYSAAWKYAYISLPLATTLHMERGERREREEERGGRRRSSLSCYQSFLISERGEETFFLHACLSGKERKNASAMKEVWEGGGRIPPLYIGPLIKSLDI